MHTITTIELKPNLMSFLLFQSLLKFKIFIIKNPFLIYWKTNMVSRTLIAKVIGIHAYNHAISMYRIFACMELL